MTVELEKLSFGRLDAESDNQLVEYFLTTPIVRQLLDGEKYLVIGRKGSGKTAIFKYLEEWGPTQYPNREFINLDLVDYVFEVHAKLSMQMSEASAYTASWKIVILYAVAAQNLNNLGESDRKIIRDAFRRIGMTPESTKFGGIVKWFRNTKSAQVELPVVGGAVQAESGSESGLSLDIVESINEIEEVFAESFSASPYCVLVDRLDDVWRGREEDRQMLAGAIRAARAINAKMPHEGTAGPAPVILFLRTDLLDALAGYNDLNKTRQDQARLEWDAAQLAEVVARRISTSTGGNSNHAWSIAFTDEIVKNRQPARDYIPKRTMMRPRDIIAFCIEANDQRRNAGLGSKRISSAQVLAAEEAYSTHMLNELRDEIAARVEDFTKVVMSLRRLKQKSFNDDEWLTACRDSSVGTEEAATILQLLFDASAVGIFQTGGGGGGSKTLFRYQDNYLQLQPGQRLQVHQSLLKALKLTDR